MHSFEAVWLNSRSRFKNCGIVSERVGYLCSPPGSRSVNTEPLPGSLATVTSPPIMRASLRAMASPSRHRPLCAERDVMEFPRRAVVYCGLMLAARTTLPHFSVYWTMCLPNSADELASGANPKSARRAFIL